jgi:hypothetical protein
MKAVMDFAHKGIVLSLAVVAGYTAFFVGCNAKAMYDSQQRVRER